MGKFSPSAKGLSHQSQRPQDREAVFQEDAEAIRRRRPRPRTYVLLLSAVRDAQPRPRRLWFFEELEAARKNLSFDLWAYVLMPEHVHLLIYPRGAAKPAQIVGKIKEAVARKAIAYLACNAPQRLPRLTVREGERVRHRFWQPGGGYDRNAVEIATVHQMIQYIHANPVRRGLVANAEDWEWSGARWYAGIQPVRIEIDNTIPPEHEMVRLGRTP